VLLLTVARVPKNHVASWAIATLIGLVLNCERVIGIEETRVSVATGGSSGGMMGSILGGATSQHAGGATHIVAGMAPWDVGLAGDGNAGSGAHGGVAEDAAAGIAGAPPTLGESGQGGDGGRNDGVGVSGWPGDDWSPIELPGLVLWLEPGGMVVDAGSAITVWQDVSPYGHQAIQAAPGSRPQRVEQAFGEQAAAQFDGVDDFLVVEDHDSLRLGTRPFVVEVLYSHTTPIEESPYGTIVLSKQDSMSPFTGIGVFANRPIADHRSTRHAVQLDVANIAFSSEDERNNDDTPWLVGFFRRSSDEFELRLNGRVVDLVGVQTGRRISVDAVSCATDEGLALPCDVRIAGAGNGSEQSLRGRIAEVVVVEGSTEQEVETLEAHLLRKYGAVLSREP
jgi:hypothetical protein